MIIQNNFSFNFKNTYTTLPSSFYTKQLPLSVKIPKMVIFNESLALDLSLNIKELKENANIFCGNTIPYGASPISQAYAGYQFGNFTMLGDGRAILLGEHVTPNGEMYDVQLKGAGKTKYSRSGDGLAAISPMIREYIISEAMHYLGIPTTRSLAVVLTNNNVLRERVLQSAILTRIAKSHIRVGTFDFASAFCTTQDVKQLADYTILRHFSSINNENDKYLLMFREVCKLQASLISKWQLVGFIHGVMNTDNMQISGETIDYGPCAFMDIYNQNTVFSSIDINGRYSYKNQPSIGAWNLARLAESMLPLFHKNEPTAVEIVQQELLKYWDYYTHYWLQGFREKLGIFNEEEDDINMCTHLLNIMKENKLDFTNTFSTLTNISKIPSPLLTIPEFNKWYNTWHQRKSRQPQNKKDVTNLMKKSNPHIIPRNYHVEEVLKSCEEGDYTPLYNFLNALQKPYEYNEKYSTIPSYDFNDYKTFCGT